MNLPRHQLLPGATLSGDQYGRRCGRHLPDDGEDLLHRRGGSHQVPEYAMQTQFALQFVGFLQASLVTDRTVQEGIEGARFHRLFQEPEWLEIMHCRQRLFYSAEAVERDRRSEVAAFLQMPEQFKAVHARHHQVRDDDIRVEGTRSEEHTSELQSLR